MPGKFVIFFAFHVAGRTKFSGYDKSDLSSCHGNALFGGNIPIEIVSTTFFYILIVVIKYMVSTIFTFVMICIAILFIFIFYLFIFV